MNLAQPERVLKAIIRLLEEHKASMIFTCVEEANSTEYYTYNETIMGQLKNNTRNGVNAQGTDNLG